MSLTVSEIIQRGSLESSSILNLQNNYKKPVAELTWILKKFAHWKNDPLSLELFAWGALVTRINFSKVMEEEDAFLKEAAEYIHVLFTKVLIDPVHKKPYKRPVLENEGSEWVWEEDVLRKYQSVTKKLSLPFNSLYNGEPINLTRHSFAENMMIWGRALMEKIVPLPKELETALLPEVKNFSENLSEDSNDILHVKLEAYKLLAEYVKEINRNRQLEKMLMKGLSIEDRLRSKMDEINELNRIRDLQRDAEQAETLLASLKQLEETFQGEIKHLKSDLAQEKLRLKHALNCIEIEKKLNAIYIELFDELERRYEQKDSEMRQVINAAQQRGSSGSFCTLF